MSGRGAWASSSRTVTAGSDSHRPRSTFLLPSMLPHAIGTRAIPVTLHDFRPPPPLAAGAMGAPPPCPRCRAPSPRAPVRAESLARDLVGPTPTLWVMRRPCVTSSARRAQARRVRHKVEGTSSFAGPTRESGLRRQLPACAPEERGRVSRLVRRLQVAAATAGCCGGCGLVQRLRVAAAAARRGGGHGAAQRPPPWRVRPSRLSPRRAARGRSPRR